MLGHAQGPSECLDAAGCQEVGETAVLWCGYSGSMPFRPPGQKADHVFAAENALSSSSFFAAWSLGPLQPSQPAHKASRRDDKGEFKTPIAKVYPEKLNLILANGIHDYLSTSTECGAAPLPMDFLSLVSNELVEGTRVQPDFHG